VIGIFIVVIESSFITINHYVSVHVGVCQSHEVQRRENTNEEF